MADVDEIESRCSTLGHPLDQPFLDAGMRRCYCGARRESMTESDPTSENTMSGPPAGWVQDSEGRWAPHAESPVMLLADDDALVEHLHGLNESGVHPIAVGIDARHQPFLITFTEPDLVAHVFYDSPWQSDIDWTTGETYCDECTGHLHGLDDIRFPVTIMRSTEPVLR